MSTPALPRPSIEETLREVEELHEKLKKEKKKRKKLEEKGGLGSSRGIETMFRTTFQSHNDLVALADNKANMMISVNGIIISILVASLTPRLQESGLLLLPSGALLLGCLGSLVCSVMAARPRVTRVPVSLEDVKAGNANLLFFGSFLNMPQEDYIQGMRILIENPEQAYLTMVRNLYTLGHILEKKFRLLWMSYTVFLAGLSMAVVLAVVMLARWLVVGPVAVP
jgi:hypothetical protein